MEPQEPLAAPTLLAAQLDAPGLVFLGVAIFWRPRPSDLTANTALAEKWESTFTSWEVSERQVDLARSNEYRVILSDGGAQFLVETGQGYESALTQVPDLLAHLQASKRPVTRATVEIQYMIGSASTFQDRMARVAALLFRDTFPSSLKTKLVDFAYLNDMEIDGEEFQLNIGVIREHEILRRVRAIGLPEYPSVATFCSIAHVWRPTQQRDFRAAVEHLLAVGRSVTNELERQ